MIYRVVALHDSPPSVFLTIAAVGFGGGFGRRLLFLPALKDEGPCSRAGVAGLLRRDAGERRHGEVFRINH
jgi:hypothetical protein